MDAKTREFPGMEGIRAAARLLEGKAVRTPIVESAALDRQTGLRLLFKAECLQRTGSFKFRGAYNALSRIDIPQRKAGVVACSSGNHAQGVAEAARLLGMPATIVMPSDAPKVKTERTRRSGATIIPYDRTTEDREAIALEIVARTGATYIHPYENIDIIEGQGTAGLEAAEQIAELGVVPDRVLVCTGGGGLTAGVAIAVHDRFPQAAIHTVEPAGFDDTRRSLEAGERLSNADLAGSVCDALLSPTPGQISFAVNRRHIASGLSVDDNQVFEAIILAFDELKLVVEPGGAVAFAAAMKHAADWRGQTVLCIISGGNIDRTLFASILSGPN